MQKTIYDVCVVGSGPGGGITAYALSIAGLKVALIEAGPKLRAGIDYNAHGNPYDVLEKRLKAGLRGAVGTVTDYSSYDHFTGVGDNPRHGQLRALGGRSLCWAGHSLRFGPGDFKHWPIGYDEVAPYYSKAEKLMGVYGSKDGLWNMPDGEFLKSVPMRCGENALKRGVAQLKTKGRKMEFVDIRKAILTEQRAGDRAKCHYCGHCQKGCEVESKYTSANTPIPKALATGNLSLFTERMMTRIVMDRGRNRVKAVETVNGKGETESFECRTLVMSCSAVETARHLLINNLANSSGQVGRNLTSHFGLTVTGLFEHLRHREASNDDATDYYLGLLTAMYWDQPSKDFEGTYQVQCGSGVTPLALRIRDVPGFGSKLKRELIEYNKMHVGMNMQGSLLVSAKKYVDLDRERKDRFGLPLPRVHLHYEENDLAMARDVVRTCEEIIDAGGGKVYSKPRKVTPQSLVIDSNHWVGTTRMGRDAKTSVVTTDGQSHDIPNLWVGDASVFAAYPEKNPTLTNIAMSWRMSERLAAKAKRGEL